MQTLLGQPCMYKMIRSVLGDNLVSWSAKRQPTVIKSSAEGEKQRQNIRGS